MVVRHNLHRNVRILLVGDRGVGKTSLILSLVSEEFPEDVPPKSEEITIPADVTPELVPTNIVDYSAVEQSDMQLVEEVQRANVICVVYSVDDDDTMDRVTSYWLPFLRETLSHTHRCPVVLVGNKVDLVDYSTVDAAMDIMNDYKEVESFVECSAKTLNNISEMFYYAQKAVLHPTGPLYITDKQDLTEPCKKALTRIFKICDLDNDGLLNDHELNYFQKRCFDSPLRPEAMDDIKALLKRNISGGVSNSNCITLSGFLFLHLLFLQRGRSHTTWAVLRSFGYNDHLRMDSSYLFPKLKVPYGCSTELSYRGQMFFLNLFERFDSDKDGALSPHEQEKLFSICPAPPWRTELKHIVPTNSQGWVTADGFLCFWVLTTLQDPNTTLEYLAHFGYVINETESQLSALQVTREKSLDLLKKQSTRNVYECHVFGAKGVGKTTLCQGFIGRKYQASEVGAGETLPTSTVNSVIIYGQEKFLVLKEMNVQNINSLTEMDVSCDVVCLVYDCSDPKSFGYVASLYKKYYVENNMPVLVVGNKCEEGEVAQEGRLQPAEFCDLHHLSPPHFFSHQPQRQKELFMKLATMAAFPRFHAAWMLFYRHTSHLKELGLLTGDSIMLKAGLGITLFAALGFIFVRLLNSAQKR
ncbi:mitochondrial Rho GTPase isoform X2 [Nilaparvata lugens]|uniref:mitochondrial Rho GTPase isoform X3 n=1 Tax=Nilaparvata lugens TaxID=108931 RepID=UPI00193D59D5|nr:mitochondrial Rho GTPase isoform X3 [Nilaparvata lugens]XP_039293051.1 mitochondrial Rho GTPase isoform X1 [Nilaparvata lugens]XP_039293052.1 mitochondrial Rho GTPase isoform X2 [Nilaparvata lugens]